MASMYKSIKYCGKHKQKYILLWQAHTTKHSIMAIMYKSKDYYCQHVQEHTASWPTCTSIRSHGIKASMFKSPQCHDQHIQDCMASVWLSNSSTFSLCGAVLTQLLVTSECHIADKCDCLNITFHRVQNNHHLHTDINRHGEAHRCSTTLSNASITLILPSSC